MNYEGLNQKQQRIASFLFQNMDSDMQEQIYSYIEEYEQREQALIKDRVFGDRKINIIPSIHFSFGYSGHMLLGKLPEQGEDADQKASVIVDQKHGNR